MIFFDAHAHIPSYSADIEEQMQEALRLQLGPVALGGINPKDWQKQLEIRSQRPTKTFLSFGLHPWHVIESSEGQLDKDLQTLQAHLPQAEALGEVGLDRFRSSETLEKQQHYMTEQLNLLGHKVLVLHVVQAHDQALKTLSRKQSAYQGVAHGFSGSVEVAQRYVHLGFSISVGPSLLKNGFKGLKETVKKLPLDQLVIESDDESPRGPLDTLYSVAQEIARIKDTTLEKVVESTYQSALKLYGEKQ